MNEERTDWECGPINLSNNNNWCMLFNYSKLPACPFHTGIQTEKTQRWHFSTEKTDVLMLVLFLNIVINVVPGP